MARKRTKTLSVEKEKIDSIEISGTLFEVELLPNTETTIQSIEIKEDTTTPEINVTGTFKAKEVDAEDCIGKDLKDGVWRTASITSTKKSSSISNIMTASDKSLPIETPSATGYDILIGTSLSGLTLLNSSSNFYYYRVETSSYNTNFFTSSSPYNSIYQVYEIHQYSHNPDSYRVSLGGIFFLTEVTGSKLYGHLLLWGTESLIDSSSYQYSVYCRPLGYNNCGTLGSYILDASLTLK